MVLAGCVFVAGIHLSRVLISGSFESVRWNACDQRLDIDLYSHQKEFFFWGGGRGGGDGVTTHVSSKGKISSIEKFIPRGLLNPRRCIKQDSIYIVTHIVLLASPTKSRQTPSMLTARLPNLVSFSYSHLHSYTLTHFQVSS